MKSTLCRAYLNVFDATLDSTFALGLRSVPPNSNEQIEEWISVENIASIRKRQTGNTSKKNQGLREVRKNVMIPLLPAIVFLERDFPHMSITLMRNPPGDGNC